MDYNLVNDIKKFKSNTIFGFRGVDFIKPKIIIDTGGFVFDNQWTFGFGNN